MPDESRTFNLVTEPWIPVPGHGYVSLMDVFTDLSLRRFGNTAVEKVVLLRLFLCIAHASTTIPDELAWASLEIETLATNARAYLDKWKDRFDLYDPEKPFAQFPQLKGKCKPAQLGAIASSVAWGNRTILTQWQGGADFSVQQAVLLLLIGICYGMGGKKYDTDVTLDANCPKKKSASLGTLTGFKGFLHSAMQGETILETVHLNMLTAKEIASLNVFRAEDPIGKPFWEAMPDSEINKSAELYKNSYQGILFPMNKFFCLDIDLKTNEEILLMIDGINYPGHKDGQWDPGVTIFSDGKDNKALWSSTEKKPWRQLPAMLQFLEANSQRSNPAFLINAFHKMSLLPSKKSLDGCDDGNSRQLGVWTGGLAVNNNLGEQYVSARNDYVESDVTLPVRWIEENQDAYLKYKKYMEDLDALSSMLYLAVMRYYKTLKDQTKSQSNCKKNNDKTNSQLALQAQQLFWEKMEAFAQDIFDLTEQTDEEVAQAYKSWKQIGWACYDTLCPHETPRQIQAYVLSRPTFVPSKKNTKNASAKKETKNASAKKETKNASSKKSTKNASAKKETKTKK